MVHEKRVYCERESPTACAERAALAPEAGARAVHQQRALLGVPAIRAEVLTLVCLTSLLSPLASHILHFSSVSCFTAR